MQARPGAVAYTFLRLPQGSWRSRRRRRPTKAQRRQHRTRQRQTEIAAAIPYTSLRAEKDSFSGLDGCWGGGEDATATGEVKAVNGVVVGVVGTVVQVLLSLELEVLLLVVVLGVVLVAFIPDIGYCVIVLFTSGVSSTAPITRGL